MLWELSTTDWITSFGFISCLTYISGWLADGLMRSSAFGHVGNWLVIMIGAYISMYTFNMYGYKFRYDPVFTLTCVSAGAGLFFLFSCISKRIFVR